MNGFPGARVKPVGEELPLPVHQSFVPVPRVLASVTADWKGRESATELTAQVRKSLEGAPCDFEDATYTAELARRDVLSLFRQSEGRRSSGSFEVFEETDLRNL